MVFTNRKENINKLIEGCRRNDRRSQLKLYNKYSKAMFAISINMVKEITLAEDLMQESFISAYKKINSYSGDVSFGAWLKKIVINKCLDHLKKKRIDFESVDSFNDITEPDQEIINEIDVTKVNEIKNEILQLPDGYRAILTLYLLEGYDHEEIAQILNISSSTSRSQYTRAKALLLKRIDKKQTDKA